jgi:para-aminobenzoate synthetase/4-amino-4-deoxychorismate lyase
MNREEMIICRLPSKEGEDISWALFREPLDVVVANFADDVIPALNAVDEYVSSGKYAAGFISYEAAPAFDEANSVNSIPQPDSFPLLSFGIYDKPAEIFSSLPEGKLNPPVNLISELLPDDYLERIKTVKDYITDGDIYQANFTFRSKSANIADPYNLFLYLMNEHPVPYGAYVDTGDFQIVSLSPELFIEKNGDQILSIPMKGTASRALTLQDDLKVAANLAEDSKNRAENIMIVDMVRNDLGRICKTGSIYVDPLCKVDTYSTLHQMISEVRGTLKEKISLSEIFKAMFPAASITGAPKIRAMEIIKELEISPRKVYTGTIGCITPDCNFCFNVPIRTLLCTDKGAELGIGSGIVADSVPEDEWSESILKSSFLSSALPEFRMLETILLKNGELVLLEEHLARVRDSQNYFGFVWNREKIMNALNNLPQLSDESAKFAKIRLLVSRNGDVEVEAHPLESDGWGKKSLRIKISDKRTDSKDLFLYHKTTNRDFYNLEYRKALGEGVDEVIFMNEKGELTEGAITNIFIMKNGEWFTPQINCGLLPGVWRSKLIKELRAVETILYPDDLKSAEKILICNSLRGSGESLIVNC